MDKKSVDKIFAFLIESEKLKTVKRKIRNSKGEFESDADHSWHLALSVMVLKDEFDSQLDYTKMLEMALIHDLPEIYAGDAFSFDKKARESKDELEKAAAKKLFGILPEGLNSKLNSQFIEFEETKTQEAKILQALDKLNPDMHNYIGKGDNWTEFNITKKMLLDYKQNLVSVHPATKYIFDKIIAKADEENWFPK